jgi:hypothetical protein
VLNPWPVHARAGGVARSGLDQQEQQIERPLSLNAQRHAAVLTALKACGARRVLNPGCAQGGLMRLLLSDGQSCRCAATELLKVCSRESLRIIYGSHYTAAENLVRLRSRGLGRKRALALALRQFALGLESLERFVRREPLRRVHQCVFGVLSLESEPVDPRL